MLSSPMEEDAPLEPTIWYKPEPSGGPMTSRDVDYEEDMTDDAGTWTDVVNVRAHLGSHHTDLPTTDLWMLDSGCSHNLTPHLPDIRNPRPNARAIQGIGSTAPKATHSGSIRCTGHHSEFDLFGTAYHLPTLQHRLFSVSKALKTGFSILLQPPTPNNNKVGYLTHPTHGTYDIRRTTHDRGRGIPRARIARRRLPRRRRGHRDRDARCRAA